MLFILFQSFEMEDTPKAEDQLPEGASESAPQKMLETREEMLSRHRYFIRPLGKTLPLVLLSPSCIFNILYTTLHMIITLFCLPVMLYLYPYSLAHLFGNAIDFVINCSY